jgi:hypothetical protein
MVDIEERVNSIGRKIDRRHAVTPSPGIDLVQLFVQQRMTKIGRKIDAP